jgi:two-component system cell cycle response regulator DivK
MSRILLVEDNEMNRDMLTRRLTKHGFQVTVATDGMEGLEEARSKLPDLILLDLGLPLMDGWEVGRRIRADGQTSRIPIVVLTAHAMISDRRRALEAGFNAFATKPVDFQNLLKLMREVLGNTQEPPQ